MTTPAKFPILQIETNHTLYECVVTGPEENGSASIYFQGDLESGEEIVKRCNAFPALYAAMEKSADILDRAMNASEFSDFQSVFKALQQARAALALARGGAVDGQGAGVDSGRGEKGGE